MSLGKRPLFSFAAAVVIGILAGEYVGLAATAGVLCFLAIALFILDPRTRNLALPAVLLLATLFASSLNYRMYTRVTPDDISHLVGQGRCVTRGVVVEDPEVVGDTARLRVKALSVDHRGESFQTGGRLLCTVHRTAFEPSSLPRYGSRVILEGELTSPAEPTNPGRFSYRKYLARQRIYATMYIRYPHQLRLVESRDSNAFIAAAGAARRGIARSLERLMPQPEAGVAAGMALGTYSTLPEDILTAFSRTGTLHLMAASGFNCAIIFGFTLLVFKLLGAPRRWSYLAAIVPLFFYMFIVGVKPSIFRATKVAVLVSGSKFFGRIADPLNILCAASIIILAYRPTDLFDVGFQLSFAAVISIILLLPVVQPILDRRFNTVQRPYHRPSGIARLGLRAGRSLCEAVALTFAATLGTLPITAHYFNYVSVVSLPANAAVVLMIPAIFLLSLAAPVLEFMPYAGELTAAVGTAIIRVMLLVLSAFAAPSWSSVTLGSPGLFGSSGYYLAAGAVLAYVARRQ